MGLRYEYFSLAPNDKQEGLLWDALTASREVFNLALYDKKSKNIDSLALARKFTELKKTEEPELAILPYRSIEAILRQIDTYTMNNHCLPKFAKSNEWTEIPYKQGVKPMDGAVWVPKIGEIEAPQIVYASPFRMAWVVRDTGCWRLKTKSRSGTLS
jgi:hypothetical protein